MMQPTAEQRAAWKAEWLSRSEPADYRNWLERKLATLEIENAELKSRVVQPSARPTEIIATMTIENHLTNKATVTVISVPSLHFRCPFCGVGVWFHTQRQLEIIIQEHLRLAHARTTPAKEQK